MENTMIEEESEPRKFMRDFMARKVAEFLKSTNGERVLIALKPYGRRQEEILGEIFMCLPDGKYKKETYLYEFVVNS